MSDDVVDVCPSIDTVKAHQAARGITGHLAWMGRDRFVLAHTDPERATGKPLHQCRVHRALAGLDAYRGEPGYHLVEVIDGLLTLTPVTDEGAAP